MSVTAKGFEERAATVFEEKRGNVDNKLFNKLKINEIFLLLLSPNASEND